jgi:predicted O-linked N-acetylglucosamine transferase (SPINDLY family)
MYSRIKVFFRKEDFLKRVLRKIWTWRFRLEIQDVPRLVVWGKMPRRIRNSLETIRFNDEEKKALNAFESSIFLMAAPTANVPRRILQKSLRRANRDLLKGRLSGCLDRLKQEYRKTPDHRLLYAIYDVVHFLAALEPTLFEIETPVKLLSLMEGSLLTARFRLAEIYEKRGMIDEALSLLRKSRENLTVDQYSLMLQTMLKSPTVSSLTLLKEQKAWAERYKTALDEEVATAAPSVDESFRVRKIRIAYHCTFWDTYCIRYQLLPVIKNHDRSRFEVICYSPSKVSEFTSQFFESVHIVGDLDDQQFVQLVRSHKVDILVECSGFSPGHRFSAMAGRCAPIQVSYLNHTGTSGTPNIDYVLADDVALKREEDSYFTERIFRLPRSFFCFNFESDSHPEPNDVPARTNGFITFGCFASRGKINETLISWWAEILKRTEGAKLYIRNRELTPKDNQVFLQSQFEKYGIPQERLLIAGGLERNEIVACYGAVDISLDTWPYSGGNTIAESLWQGVPIVTYRGQRFSSSYGASLVAASGCGNLIANDEKSYIDIAVDLAGDLNKIDYYRKNLRQLARDRGFNNAQEFAKELEKAFMSMMESAIASSRHSRSAILH